MTGIFPPGSLFAQGADDRRKLGAHYTPASLTRPIVATTLRPILEQRSVANGHPCTDLPEGQEAREAAEQDPTRYTLTPEQVLDLKICDPAVGSGAFLVEVCRQLAAHLVAAWQRTGTTPADAGADLELHARRMVAQRCLYGVDKNPLAIDLARLSLWLLTFRPGVRLVYVDHKLRAGDALVGLTNAQIAGMHWTEQEPRRKRGALPPVDLSALGPLVAASAARAVELREQVSHAGDEVPTTELRRLHEEERETTAFVRFVGDLVIGAFFAKSTEAERFAELERRCLRVAALLTAAAEIRKEP